jgi:hypothetical protein
LSDTKTFFSKNHGWPSGMGDRNGRWAMVIDKDGKIIYADNEKQAGQVTVGAGYSRKLTIANKNPGLWRGCRPRKVVKDSSPLTLRKST